MQPADVPCLSNRAFDPSRLRRTVLDMAYAGSTVHIGCAFSIIELLAVLYRRHLRYSQTDPRAPDRDLLVLSKGHGVMAQYACMREIGWIDDAAVRGYFSDGSDLKGLSDSRVPGLEVTSGSLGHGLSVAVGMAIGAALDQSDQRVFAIVGDGEMNEGPIWEAMLLAAQHKLDNLMVIVDENGLQAMGKTEQIVGLGDLAAKFDVFGFDVVGVDGHDEAAIDAEISGLLANRSRRPKALIARTIKGYGVPFMENDNSWHYTRLNEETYRDAMEAGGTASLMRTAFSDGLVRIAAEDPRVLLLTGDHGYALFDAFRAAHPDRYINAGIAEQNMVGMAAGLARMGFRPFVYGLSAFVPVRVLEQIKLDVAHDNLPVVFVGDGAGFVYSHLGTSHQSLEDVAAVRAIPGMMVLSPADRHELTAAMDHAYQARSSVYLRMGKADLGDVHSGIARLDISRLQLLRQGIPGGTAILATGPIATTAMAVAERVEGVAVWSAPCIKPFDIETLIAICGASSRIVTMEEHSTMGGFGSVVAEEVSSVNPLPILRIGVEDRFSQHCGSYAYLLREHGLDLETVAKRVADYACAN